MTRAPAWRRPRTTCIQSRHGSAPYEATAVRSEACSKTGQEGYDVIAIDEAQDFTPCQVSA